MHFLSLTLLASLATAGPIMRRINTSVWTVSHFDVGCSPAACEYHFVVTRPAGPNNPGFNTTCVGNDLEKEYQPCDFKNVATKLIPRDYPVWEVDVKHSYEDNNDNTVNAYAKGTTNDTTTPFTVTVYKTD